MAFEQLKGTGFTGCGKRAEPKLSGLRKMSRG